MFAEKSVYFAITFGFKLYEIHKALNDFIVINRALTS